MFRLILVPTDFSEAAAAAQRHAEELARLTGAALLLVFVRDEFPFVANDGTGFVPAALKAQHAAEQEQVLALAAGATARGLVARGVMVLGAAPQRILSVCTEERADLIVMGTSSRRGLGHFVLGSVAEHVARASPVPVMVVSAAADAESLVGRPQSASTADRQAQARTILVPTDFEATSLAAVRYAFELARVMSARVHLLHVYAPAVTPGFDGWGDGAYEPLQQRARERLQEVAEPYQSSLLLGSCIAALGEPASTICETAQKLRADLIVVGSHGRSGLHQLLLGSVAEQVMRTARCPVVVARNFEQTGLDYAPSDTRSLLAGSGFPIIPAGS